MTLNPTRKDNTMSTQSMKLDLPNLRRAAADGRLKQASWRACLLFHLVGATDGGGDE